jgi:hypothetical protein
MKDLLSFLSAIVLILTAAFIGLFVGAFIGYLQYGIFYPIYAKCNPVSATEECGRGTVLAYLSMLLGGVSLSISLIIFGAAFYARSPEKQLAQKAPLPE